MFGDDCLREILQPKAAVGTQADLVFRVAVPFVKVGQRAFQLRDDVGRGRCHFPPQFCAVDVEFIIADFNGISFYGDHAFDIRLGWA